MTSQPEFSTEYTDPQASDGQPSPPPVKRLTRSTSDKILGGVCGGFSAYSGIDANLLRVIVVVLSLFSGVGIILYVAAWLLVPADNSTRTEGERIYQDVRRQMG